MASKKFSISILLIVCLGSSTSDDYFNCSRNLFDVAFIYDCRYNLSQQQDLFTLFLQKFQPLQWIRNFIRHKIRNFDFIIAQKTYVYSKLVTFQQLTRENFTLHKFKTAHLRLNTLFCFQTVKINILLNDIRKNIVKKKTTVKTKLAIFIFDDGANENDKEISINKKLPNLLNLRDDVKRVLIQITPDKTRSESVDISYIKTQSLEDRLRIVRNLFKLICLDTIDCSTKFETLPSHIKYYTIIPSDIGKTVKESENMCEQEWPESHLAYINSKSELEFLLSVSGIVGRFTSHSLVSSDKIDYKIVHIGLNSGLSQIILEGFIGLSEDSIWNDGSPLIIDPPWGQMNEGKGCVYISLNYSFADGVVTNDKHEWIKIDCNKSTSTNFLLCESQVVVEDEIELNLNDMKYNDQFSPMNLLYMSYFNLLSIQIHQHSENKLMSLFRKKINWNITQYSFNTHGSAEYGNHDYDKTLYWLSDQLLLNLQSLHQNAIKQNSILSTSLNSSYQLLVKQILGNKNLNSLNDSQFNPTYLQFTRENISNCLYETHSERQRIGFYNNSYLQKCKQFLCPPGFVKCPDSYCVPMYLVHNDIKDCPHGEDEESVKQTVVCTRKFTFVQRNMCLQQDARHDLGRLSVKSLNITNDFICPIPCDNDYVCVSNIVKRKTDNATTFHFSYLEAEVHLYEKFGLFAFTPQMYSLFLLNKLVEVDLNSCNISEFNNVIKSLDMSDIQVLDVSSNDFRGLWSFSVIQTFTNLNILNMSFNKNLEIGDNFIFPSELQVLDLSHTKCGFAVIKALGNLKHLKILVLSHIKPIELSSTGTLTLEIFDVRGTTLLNIKYGYLSWLSVKKALYADDYRICCDAIRGQNIPGKICNAPQDAISTCEDLIGNPLKRVILWIVSVLSLIGNMSVVIYRLIWGRELLKKAYGIYVVLLGISDFIMGIYLLIIASADLFYRNTYVLSDYNWRYSYICKLAGILSTFSSETSTLFICLITLDRFIVIRYPFGEHRISKFGKYISICLTFVFVALVSVIPAMFPDWELYSYNGMCLALPFSSGSYTGWEFSAFLFVGFNFIMFIIIAIGQVAICKVLFSSHRNLSNITGNTTRKAQEIAVARQLFLVALSDFCCWFPIGIIGIMSLRGFEFNLEVYAWSAVLVLPINSAINPILYTVPAILKKIK